MQEIEYYLLNIPAHGLKNATLKQALLKFYQTGESRSLTQVLEESRFLSASYLQKAKQHHQELQSQEILFVPFGSAQYPHKLYNDEFAPLWLQVIGDAKILQKPLLGAVGSRDARPMTSDWIQTHMMEFLSLTGVTTLSGGARGVDQWIHSVSLRKALPTVVVLPSGLGAMYPHGFNEWVKPIVDCGGCIVSEYFYSQSMQKHLFHQRNHLIASLSHKVLLLEGRRRSGSLITAQRAISLGRELAVIPGHPLDPNFTGVLDLVFEGASFVRDGFDLKIWFEN